MPLPTGSKHVTGYDGHLRFQQQTLDELGALESAGATATTCVIASRSAAHCCEQLGALADLTNLLTTEAR